MVLTTAHNRVIRMLTGSVSICGLWPFLGPNKLTLIRGWKLAIDAFLVYFYIKLEIMPRQSISFTKPNDEWLKSQVDSQEYSSKSELINDLIRQARKQQSQIDFVRSKLDMAEKGGFTKDRKKEILKASKEGQNG